MEEPIASSSKEAVDAPELPGSPENGLYKSRKAKMLVRLLLEAQKQIKEVTEERDRAFVQLRKMPQMLSTFRLTFDAELQRVQESQEGVLDEFKSWVRLLHKNVGQESQAMIAEQVRIKAVTDDFEAKIRDLKAQIECKKEQIKWHQQEASVEGTKCDVLNRDLYLVDIELADLRQKLEDKLFLGQHATCGHCKARERVKDAMAQQVIEKGTENMRLGKELEMALKSANDKDKITQMLSKTNQRLSFELKFAKEETEKKIAAAKKEWEKQWEAQMAQTLASWESSVGSAPPPPPRKTRRLEPSPPSDGSDTSSTTPKITPEASNPFASWGKKQEKDTESNLYLKKIAASVMKNSPARVKEEPETLATPIGDVPKLSLPIPPPPAPPPPEVMKEEKEAKTSPTKPGQLEYLESQLEGYRNLSGWYRKELKSSVDQGYYFQRELESQIEAVEGQMEELQRLKTENEELTKKVDAQKEEMEDLQGKAAQLVGTVQSYFNP